MPTYQPRDKYFRKAKERGLRSRAAFKLEEILARAKLDLSGARIADLGCAPGGWLVILACAAGPSGRVVGVDLAPVRNPPPGVVAIAGDIRDAATMERAAKELGGRADLVTSDLAPKLSGVAARDEAEAQSVLDAALEFSCAVLRPGGAMIAKLFMGARFKETVARFENDFANVDVVRTRATRPGSSELYVIARGFRGER